MLEIFLIIVGLILPLGLAKARRRRRRRNPNFVALPFRTLITLGTLAAGSLISTGTLSGNFAEDFRVISVDAQWSISGYTPVTGDGPVSVGFAHNDYSAAEIAEALEVNLLSPANKIEQERAGRLVRDVGTFYSDGVVNDLATINNGNPVRTKLNWMINDGFELDVYAFNEGADALTTGAIVNVYGKLYGYWVT